MNGMRFSGDLRLSLMTKTKDDTMGLAYLSTLLVIQSNILGRPILTGSIVVLSVCLRQPVGFTEG
jgi:hypothetical protein